MTITLNGAATELAGGLTVAALLDRLALPPAKVAIERNREIVPRSTFAQTVLADGDVVEVVTFVGGG